MNYTNCTLTILLVNITLWPCMQFVRCTYVDFNMETLSIHPLIDAGHAMVDVM